MGATDDYRVYEHNDRAKIEKEFRAACEDARYEDGNSYPGTIACFHSIRGWHDRRFATRNEAEEFLLNQHSKWEPAEAVSFLLPAKENKTEKTRRERASVSYKSWEKREQDARTKVIETFANRKGRTVACSGCGSRLSRTHLASKLNRWTLPSCPVCGESLLSKTDHERLDNIKQRVAKAKREVNEANKPTPSTKVGWIVGGWCPC